MKIININRESIVSESFLSPLLQLAKIPENLYIKGNLPVLRQPVVAIIGTRRPTPYGREVTQTLATDLARSGVVVVSGLAAGIDTIAHTATLEAGGTTIAVLAQGLHSVYPASNRGLADRISKHGALITEYDTGVDALKHHFLARNRIVSGLADAVIVTEAADRSGTFSTVAHALEQNKEVFAVPGPITSLLSAGPNRLLQQGAHVALSADDILNVIAPHLVAGQRKFVFGNTPLEVRIIELIQQGVRSGDELLAKSEASASEFMEAMTMMELNGTVRALGGNQWTI
ncbi:MAG: transcriptional regulator, MarR family [Candidatus Saccharibacteria bacterium]|nr:transcriptional regulator, MarR family [Candidatus Saccharibacteria bacterium]